MQSFVCLGVKPLQDLHMLTFKLVTQLISFSELTEVLVQVATLNYCHLSLKILIFQLNIITATSAIFSVGYFTKDVDNWITQGNIDVAPFNVGHPGQGTSIYEAAAAVGTDANDIRDWIIANYPATTKLIQMVNGN